MNPMSASLDTRECSATLAVHRALMGRPPTFFRDTPMPVPDECQSPVKPFKLERRSIVERYAKPDDLRGLWQVLSTLVPLSGLWAVLAMPPSGSYGLAALATLAMSLFLLRAFALMHDCGHSSLFRRPGLNRVAGFIFGVISGMPQYVWAQHHRYHHATNGNWAKYRGPLAILSVDEFEALSPRQRRAYVRARSVVMAPLAGLLYLVINPRLTWLKGSAALAWHVVRKKMAQPQVSIGRHARNFESRYWKTAAEYRHMGLNNIVLLAAWGLMSWGFGPALFFPFYLVSTALAGAAGIVLFTVQHNFEHSYASGDEDWNRDEAAIHGTSLLVLPTWLNWFTANIGYHHVHHLCARIPNHRLAACHAENRERFAEVRRLTLADILPSLKFLLWDTRSRRLISLAEYEAAQRLRADAQTDVSVISTEPNEPASAYERKP